MLLEALVRAPSLERLVYASSSSVYGDNTPMPMREDGAAAAGLAVRRDEARGRAALLSVLTPITACRRCRCATSRSTVHGSGRTWVSTNSYARPSSGEPITLYGDGEQTRDFTFVHDAVSATIAAGDRGVPGRVYNIGGGSRVSVNEVLENHRPRRRPRPDRRRRSRAKRRHARHLRRHVARAGGSRIRTECRTRRRDRGGSINGWPTISVVA